MAKFTSKIKTIKCETITFYNDVSLKALNAEVIEQALSNIYNFVSVETEKGKIIKIECS